MSTSWPARGESVRLLNACFADAVRRVARELTGDAARADIAVHTTLLTATREIHLLPAGGRVEPWFWAIATEVCLRLASPSEAAAAPADHLAWLLHDREDLRLEDVAWILDVTPDEAAERIDAVRTARRTER